MAHYRLALLGFGNVGRALARLLKRKEAELEQQYGINFIVTGIATGRHGIVLNPDGVCLHEALKLVESGGSLASLPGLPLTDTLDFLHSVPADVLFENSPVNYENGEPAVSYIRLALQRGMHAATANKGPVVHAYRELTDLAAAQKRRFFFESAVMDGAPIFSLFRSALPAARLLSFRGVLNSTTNLILGRMEGGESFEAAVAHAQAVGLAETDPSGDIDGWDAAVKVAALVTVLMGVPFTPQQVDRHGIRSINRRKIDGARGAGERWKLVCSASLKDGQVTARVAPRRLAPDSPLYHVEGASSIIEFHTDTLPALTILEGDPGPETTAYGLLADFINAVRRA